MVAVDETLVFALDAAERTLRHVREVRTGLKCGCVCPGCEQPLEAVNAQAATYKRRPHFRHVEGNPLADCGEQMLVQAFTAALAEARSVMLPTPPSEFEFPVPATGANFSLEVEQIVIKDSTEALLLLPTGDVLRVNILATDSRSAIGGSYDLQLQIPPGGLDDLKAFRDLRRYLTLNTSAWRWCSRQHPASQVEQGRAVGKQVEFDDGKVGPDEQSDEAETPAELQPAVIEAAPVEPGPSLPTANWTDSFVERDGSKTLFHRQKWPNGVMTEKVERVPPSRSGSLL